MKKNDNISLKRLTKDEMRAIAGFLKGKTTVDFNQVDEFMETQNKKHGIFENCVANVCQKNFTISRPIGW